MVKPLPLQYLMQCNSYTFAHQRTSSLPDQPRNEAESNSNCDPSCDQIQRVFIAGQSGGPVNMQGANCLRIEGRPPVGTQICREWVEWVAKCRHTCWACPASTIATTTCPLSSFYHCYYYLSTCPASTISIYYYLSSYYITHLFLQLLANFYFCLYYALFRLVQLLKLLL